MARGEGAEQYAATLLTVKPINTDIKVVKVRFYTLILRFVFNSVVCLVVTFA